MSLKHISILDNEEYLRQRSVEVDFNDKTYLEDIEKLREYCKNNSVFALAPVQIGILKRIIYLKNTTPDMDKNKASNYDENKILINPIIKKRIGHTRFLERCASCLDNVAIIDRPYIIEVEYSDIDGNKHLEEFKGFESTVISHEYDHLNGILHIDLADNILQMSLEETKEYRKKYPQEIISTTGDFETIKRL